MATSDPNGLPQFQGSDPADLEGSLNLLSAATSNAFNSNLRPFLVANVTARNTLANQRPPTAQHPLLVWLQNSGKFEINTGDGWRDWPELQDIPDFPEVVVPGPNELIIDGTTYQASGSWSLPASAWDFTSVKVSPAYGSFTRTLPFTPPEGWTVETFMLNNGARVANVWTSAVSGTTVTIRIVQFHSTTKVAMTIGWRLTKL